MIDKSLHSLKQNLFNKLIIKYLQQNRVYTFSVPYINLV